MTAATGNEFGQPTAGQSQGLGRSGTVRKMRDVRHHGLGPEEEREE